MNVSNKDRNHYRQMSLFGLLEHIVYSGDSRALSELHTHRRVFGNNSSGLSRFVDYVELLIKQHVSSNTTDALNFARDQTIDRFSQLSSKHGIDCRSYFACALQDKDRRPHPLDEAGLCYRLSGLVRRHFQLGLKEAYRSCTRSRYIWERDGARVELLFPKELSGTVRLQWLETHIGEDIDLSSQDARHRIQDFIDDELGYSLNDSLDGPHGFHDRLAAPGSPTDYVDRVHVEGIAQTVASEKAENLSDQRPAIRLLGGERLRELVLDIFQAIAGEDYREKEIASRFGLSPATFSRFAGSRWCRDGEHIPDLWHNLAQVLAFDVRFAGLCVDAGIVPYLDTIVTDQMP